MTLVALIRHGSTAWNENGRIQGRRDIPLSDEGRAEIARLRPPPALDGALWRSSPLSRARETAVLLGADARDDVRLIEMDWGTWEGETLEGLRARLGEEMLAAEARGLDFRPQGGESPRDVQRRLADFFADCAASERPCAAVTHKGVIRAALALATGWTMEHKAPVKLAWRAAHLFEATGDGVQLVAANVPLVPR